MCWRWGIRQRKLKLKREREVEMSREKQPFQLGTSGSLLTFSQPLTKISIVDSAVQRAGDLKGQEEHKMEQNRVLSHRGCSGGDRAGRSWVTKSQQSHGHWGWFHCKTRPAVLFSGGSVVKNLPSMQETQKTQVWSLGGEDHLEEEMATQSCILFWKFPWTQSSLVGYSP